MVGLRRCARGKSVLGGSALGELQIALEWFLEKNAADQRFLEQSAVE